MIRVEGLTKQFSSTQGIFDLDVDVGQGEVMGFIGPNGAGKSTTIRHLLGFLWPDRGRATIDNFDCWSEPIDAKRSLGCVPGEIAFPSGVAAGSFLNLLSKIRKNTVQPLRDDLVRRFQLDLSTPIKAMSKRTKQKLALVAAFMGDPAVLILDEPSQDLVAPPISLLHQPTTRRLATGALTHGGTAVGRRSNCSISASNYGQLSSTVFITSARTSTCGDL